MRSFAVVALLVSACVADVSTTTQQQHATATTIAPSKSTFSVGEPIAVTFGGFAGTATDWISIARVTDDDTTFVAWTWTDGSSEGAATLTSHLAAGEYEVRGYFDYQGSQDYIVRARKTLSVVALPPPPPPVVSATLSTSRSTYLVDETVAVDFRGLPASPLNWIGLYTAGAPSTSFLGYRYVATASGQVTFGGLAAGTYEARAFLDDGFDSVGSATFTVGAAPVTTPTISTKPLYAPGEAVVITYSTNGHATDWIGLSPVGAPATTYIRYAFVDGSGSQTFSAVPAGDYEARYYRDDAFVIASHVAFTVTAALPSGQIAIATDKATYAVGEPVVVSYLKNHASDWIAIAPAGAVATTYLDFAYVDETFTASFGGLAPGSYEARYYRDDGFVIAGVAAFTISSTTTPPPSAGPVTLSTSKSVYTDKQKVQVHYTNLGGPNDWIALALVGSPDNTFRSYQYTHGVTDGHLLFGEIEPGTYEVRAMRADSFVVEQRFSFTVVPHKGKGKN